MTPNIFQYATSELSQDAVICWLVACGKEASGPLRECGLAFIEALMRSGNEVVIDRNLGPIHHQGQFDVTEVVGEIERQKHNVDVYFRAKVDGQTIGFLIEDKTDTEMHSNQLKQYLSKMNKSEAKEIIAIKPVYFKTGHVFDDERKRAENANYSVFDADDTIRFLQDDNRSESHVFLRHFASYIEDITKKRSSAIESWDLNYDFVQWKFMTRLHRELRIADDDKLPARARNVGGGAWTQYPHWEKRGAHYWRLDSSKPLRLMIDTGRVNGDVLTIWNRWNEAFETARKESGLDAGRMKRRRRHRGRIVREGTVGAVDVGSCLEREGIDGCMERIRDLYVRFTDLAGPELR